jgi:hypothetical protein
MPKQWGIDWLSVVPVAQSRSSYNGFLIFVFVAISGLTTAFVIHRLASDRVRRAPAWDCGYPDGNPITQYTASSFAQPIRRVFGTVVFRARESVKIPPPGDLQPARFSLDLRDVIWDALYEPVAAGIALCSDQLNHLQFLTIRQFLSLVFSVLVILLMVLAIWL